MVGKINTDFENFQEMSKHLLSLRSAAKLKKATQEAIKWYTKKSNSNLKRINMSVMTKGRRAVSVYRPGQLLIYRYQSKLFHEGKLPYYDASPMVIFLGMDKHDNMSTLNLHYLNPMVRAKIMGMILKTQSTKMRHDTQMKVTWKLVKAISAYKPLQFAIKSHIPAQLRSKPFRVHSSEFHNAILMPVADFKGKTARGVWSDNPYA